MKDDEIRPNRDNPVYRHVNYHIKINLANVLRNIAYISNNNESWRVSKCHFLNYLRSGSSFSNKNLERVVESVLLLLFTTEG